MKKNNEVKEISSEMLKRLGIDGQKWAKEFIKINKEKDVADDEGTMIAWFANAIMAGYDEGTQRHKNYTIELERKLKKIGDVLGCHQIFKDPIEKSGLR